MTATPTDLLHQATSRLERLAADAEAGALDAAVALTDTVSYAISTSAGSDTVLIYGATDAATAAVAASGVTDQILTMREEKR